MKDNRDFDAKVEARVDEIFKAFAYELGENTAAYARAVLDENQPDPSIFVDDTETRAEATDADCRDKAPAVENLGFKPHRSRRILRRTLILAAALILIMGLFVVTSEGVRLKLTSLIYGENPESTRIIDDSNLIVDLEKVQLGYVPEGFEVVSDEMFMDVERRIDYRNEEDVSIILYVTRTEQYAYNVDNEQNSSETITINDKEGRLFYDGMLNTIIWQSGDCTFDVTSTLGAECLIEIARMITLN